VILYGYNVSPYAAKVRAILRYKKLPFAERIVHPLHRGALKKLSGQLAVPVIDDGGTVVADSTRIARFLDEKYPKPAILPPLDEPVLRARALLLEEWADEGLARVVQPVRWFLNEKVSMRLYRSAYPGGRRQDLEWAAVSRLLHLDFRRKYGERFGAQSPAEILARLAEVCDLLDGALAETGWLAGPSPTVADFAAWGSMGFLEDLDGWETVKARCKVAGWLKELKALASDDRLAQAEAYDADDAAMLDASHHRRATQPSSKKRLPVL
jgi:glutathione S-transferase